MSRPRSIFRDPGRIAPSVNKAWRDDFIVELRLLSAPGPRIGDELMTVETHVAESGESARTTFGEAKGYAREIAEATGASGRSQGFGPATLVGSGLGLVGMLATVRSFSTWLEGGPVGITAGELVGLGVVLALVGAVVLTGTLRRVIEHPWRAALLPALLIGILVGTLMLLSEPVLTVATLPLGVAGVLLLLVGAAVTWGDGRHDAEEIVAPGQTPRPALPGRLLAAGVMSLMTLLLLGQVWLLHTLAR